MPRPAPPRSLLHGLLLALLPALGLPVVAQVGAPSAASLAAESQRQSRIAPEDSRRLAEQALLRHAEAPDPAAAAQAHLLLCEHHAEGDRARAEGHLGAARELLGASGRPAWRARALGCEGEIAEHAGDTAAAGALYEQAVLVAEPSGDEEMLADALFRRGYLRGLRGELGPGLEDLKRAQAVYARLDLRHHLLTAQNAIAILYNRMGDSATARQWFERALAEQQQAGLLREQIVTQHNLGRVLEKLGEPEAARQAYETVLALSRELRFPRGEAYALRGLASVRIGADRAAQALPLLAEAQRQLRVVHDARLGAQLQYERGRALRALRRPGEALAPLEDALRVFRGADSLAELTLVHGELSRAHADVGEWRRAWEHESEHRALTQRLLERQVDERFSTLKVDLDRASREQELKLLQREQRAVALALEQERRANALQQVALALGSVLVAVLGALAWRHRRTSRAMRLLAMTDELTGLPNRRDVLQRLEALLGVPSGTAPQPTCAVLIVDVDHFKAINDRLGHDGGDDALRAVATQLRETGREPVHLGRLGGEEFVIVLPGADRAVARTVAERLREGVAALRLAGPDAPPLTISIGLAEAQPGDDASSLLRRADAALFAAKQSGRNQVQEAPRRAEGALLRSVGA